MKSIYDIWLQFFRGSLGLSWWRPVVVLIIIGLFFGFSLKVSSYFPPPDPYTAKRVNLPVSPLQMAPIEITATTTATTRATATRAMSQTTSVVNPTITTTSILSQPITLPLISPLATPTPTPIVLPTPLAGAAEIVAQVPILMYHYLSVPPRDADIYRLDLSVTPANFEAQLAYLQEAGYTSISMATLIQHLSGHTDLPPKPIIITFDDGYVDNYANAFPLLQKYGFQATFSLVTQPIDFGDPNYMSWENVIEMHAAGMEFGAHTYRHLDLRRRDVDFLVYEIVGSKEAIEARINEPVRFFVYPAGRYDQLVIDVIASAHFWGALTTQYGSIHTHANRFELSRIRMRGADTLEVFKAKVAR